MFLDKKTNTFGATCAHIESLPLVEHINTKPKCADKLQYIPEMWKEEIFQTFEKIGGKITAEDLMAIKILNLLGSKLGVRFLLRYLSIKTKKTKKIYDSRRNKNNVIM